MRLKKTKLINLGCALLFASGLSAQYNADYKMGQYQDDRTIESTVDIGNSEVLTVGTITAKDDDITHKDIILTRLDSDGNIIWNIRYGTSKFDEDGNGITLAWDKEHVIVVGSILETGILDRKVVDRNALVLKVRIADGAVVWSNIYGAKEIDDQAFLVKRNIKEKKSYIVVGTSFGDPEQVSERMYNFSIEDNGSLIWSNRYYLPYDFPIRSIKPTSMVENGEKEFMVAGTRTEVNRPTHLFTIGISRANGSVTQDLFHYPISEVYHVTRCDIDRHPEGEGFGLAFTANDFSGRCLIPVDFALDKEVDRIGVIRLNKDRKVVWGNVYWAAKTTNNDGLSLTIEDKQFKVCVNFNTKDRYNTPGFLRLEESDGSVISTIIHHIPQSETDYGPLTNQMIRSSDKDFYIKSIYEKWGFSMVNTDPNGKANCVKEEKVVRCKLSVKVTDEKVDPKEYGKDAKWELKRAKVKYGEDFCKTLDGLKQEEGNGSEDTGNTGIESNQAVVYPSPLGADDVVLNVRFTSDREVEFGHIRIINSQGQEVMVHATNFIEGVNQLTLETANLPSGMYLVVVSANGEITEQMKLIKQ